MWAIVGMLFLGLLLNAYLQGAKQRVNPIDGMVEMYVSAGYFTIGQQANNLPNGVSALPPREIWLDAFWISKTQVTNAQYHLCIEAEACPPPVSAEHNPHYSDPQFAEHPVVYVSWFGAEAYCHWSGGRLPTEAEWEKAARGPEKNSFAWGEDDDVAQYAHVGLGEDETTVPVGSFPLGASLYGLLDMGGNVREWVADWYAEDYEPDPLNPHGPEAGELRVLRGASWLDARLKALAFSRLAHDPGSAGHNRGFRCAYDVDAAK